ncbi:hypothetical protein SAMN05428934_102182 [Tessaracoccus flavus]|nr:hypothetical protein SAMN05428934_102182 [Tessaracoccus flavus]
MFRWAAGLVCAALVASCAPGPVEPPQPTTASSRPTLSASASPSAEPSLLPDEDLPLAFVVGPALLPAADRVVARLHRAAGHLPVLRVDLTREQATLTALLPDNAVVSYRWRDDEITRVESDIQYFDQATFDPSDYPLDAAERMFDVADLQGVRGELVLQIVEYRAGQVAITITSRPETNTIFFRPDGSAVATLGVTSVADIAAGLQEVIGEATEAYAVGFDATRGYWADLPDDDAGVVLSRSRVGGVPTFETRRLELPTLEVFDPSSIRAAPLAQAIARAQDDADTSCAVQIDRSLGRSGPVAKIDCDGTVTYADLDGRDMTALIG